MPTATVSSRSVLSAMPEASAVPQRIMLAQGRSAQAVAVPGTVDYEHPVGEKGWYLRGLNTEHDGAYDVRRYYGLRLKVKGEKDRLMTIRCCLKRAATPVGARHNLADSTTARVRLLADGQWQEACITLAAFDYNRGQEHFLKFIQRVEFALEYADGGRGKAEVADVCFVKGHTLSVESDVYSRPLDDSLRAEYQLRVTNVSGSPQSVGMLLKRSGWEGLQVDVAPASLFLQPDETAQVRVTVRGSREMPTGAQEATVLQAVPFMAGGKAEEVELLTVVPVASPFLLHDEAGWAEVRRKIGRYDWAKAGLRECIDAAERFQVPEVKRGTMSDQGTEGLVRAYIEGPLRNTAVAYYLTGNKTYGEKAAETLRRLTDPELGYPRTHHLTLQGIPQEGGTMEGLLWTYDLLKGSGLLSEEDCRNAEYTFRLYCMNIIDMMGEGGISNWSVFNLVPAAECALLLHDMHLFRQLAYGPCGLVDHLRYATMDDGWWYEMSLSYNLGCATCFTTLAWALQKFGIDWVHQDFPAPLTRNVGLRPFEYENLQGMAFGKFGPQHHNTINIKRMWDGILLFPDYRGVMFGMGDGHEQQLNGGDALELAYYVFRDPAYATVLRRSEKRSLLYGVPDLPEDTLRLFARSGYADNAGLAVLRSQKAGRPAREQIQVAVKYGTHGGYHGHFDRISLLSLMRYGRSFYNPETSWFGYGSYMYKWWVQPSMSHNMVVVDGQMQEPTSCDRLLFHTGEMMQVVCVATEARWSQPPYMGGYDQVERVREGRAPYVPLPENLPVPGDIGTYSEPVHQRRLTVVTDDYVLVADYLKGQENHVFDNLWQFRGARPGAGLEPDGESPQWDTDPLSSGQFITSVRDYTCHDGGKVESVHHFAPKDGNGKNRVMNNWETGGQNRLYNEPGDLHLDAWLIWPRQAQVRIGDYAESWGNDRLLDYQVKADGAVLAAGRLRAWLLGDGVVDVDLSGKKELCIEVKTDRGKGKDLSLMMADAVLQTADGRRIRLSSLGGTEQNVKPLPENGKDYEGGPVKLAGRAYTDVVGVEPDDVARAAVLRYHLDGLQAERLTAVLGCDYFVGDESQVRQTVGVRRQGKEACYVTLVEPYEDRAAVKAVRAVSEAEVEVELADGRMQRLRISGFYQPGETVRVEMEEWKDGRVLRREQTD